MGSGKTTVGRLLAQRSGRPFVDNDVQLAGTAGRSAREIQSEAGFDALHALERAALNAALDGSSPAVIAAAASVIDDPAMRARLQREAVVIWLKADADVLADRVTNEPHRPLEPDFKKQLQAQEADRSRHFSEIADLTVDAGGSPETVVDAVIAQRP